MYGLTRLKRKNSTGKDSVKQGLNQSDSDNLTTCFISSHIAQVKEAALKEEMDAFNHKSEKQEVITEKAEYLKSYTFSVIEVS